VNVPLIVAGSLAILGAAIHGVAGEILVVRKLSLGTLPPSRFGGPRTTKTMIHVSWHLTTVAFLIVGSALLLSGSVLDGVTARGIGVGRRDRVHRLRGGRGRAGSCLLAIPTIPAPPPRSRPAHCYRGIGVVGSSLKKMRVAATTYDLLPGTRRSGRRLPHAKKRL
jgi:hypothetical protein